MSFYTIPDVLALPAAPPDVVVPYGDDPAQCAELRLPATAGPHPVVVVIHGGCWLGEHDNASTQPLADALRLAGYATWHLEYRRLGMAGGGWPGTLLDVGRGLDALRSLAQHHQLDLSRVVTLGHSAGGHLALWAAARHRVPAGSELRSADPLAVSGAVSLAGILDLRAFLGMQSASCGGPVVTRLLGGTPEEMPERYSAASPAEMLPLGVRQVSISCAYDEIVPPSLGAAYVRAARAAGDRVDEVVIENAAHFELIAPGSIAWPAVEAAVRQLGNWTTGKPEN
jgi:acetyl esterase/lipase